MNVKARRAAAIVLIGVCGAIAGPTTAYAGQRLPTAIDGPGWAAGALQTQLKPADIAFTPTAGGPSISGTNGLSIKWRTWSARRAVGAAAFWLDSDEPNVADGYRAAETMTITLSAPVKVHGQIVFSRMTFTHIKLIKKNAKVLKNFGYGKLPRRYFIKNGGYWGSGYGWAANAQGWN